MIGRSMRPADWGSSKGSVEALCSWYPMCRASVRDRHVISRSGLAWCEVVVAREQEDAAIDGPELARTYRRGALGAATHPPRSEENSTLVRCNLISYTSV
jgi:hypothetical protein